MKVTRAILDFAEKKYRSGLSYSKIIALVNEQFGTDYKSGNIVAHWKRKGWKLEGGKKIYIVDDREPENEKKRGRPPKYSGTDEIPMGLVKLAYEMGATDAEVAEGLDISERTLNEYKKKYPGFLESINESKYFCNEKIRKRFFDLCMGYKTKEVKRTIITDENGRQKVSEIVITEKEQKPDRIAIIIWLTLRKHEEFANMIIPGQQQELPDDEHKSGVLLIEGSTSIEDWEKEHGVEDIKEDT